MTLVPPVRASPSSPPLTAPPVDVARSPGTDPPVDVARSPYTGWTRAHWEAVADHLLSSVRPYATEDFAQIRLPGRPGRAGPASDGLEGYARTFLLAAFRIAGAAGEAPGGLIERYARGLVAGTDPAHRYAWPALTDMSQPLVEAASVALALQETRPWLYDRLSPAEQDRVVAWLAGFIGRRTPASNWVLFRVVVQQFLANVGGPHEPAEISSDLERIEQWYVGDGWYSDGEGQNFDYYGGWAMHLYPVLWARMAGDKRRGRRYADRLRTFLGQYQHLFAADGGPVHQGRSLTYRFATVAPLWLGALVDATPLAPGTTRRIASGVLRHFVDRGAPDDRGLLNLGWYGPFLPSTQSYSGPGSPYWAGKAFLGLLLPPEHPVWVAAEAGAPVDTADHVLALPGPGWLLQGTRADGVVRLVNHGSDRASRPLQTGGPDPHYVRLGYSTHTGPQVDPGSVTDPVDGHLAVVAPDGSASRRHRIIRIGLCDRFAASAYTDELPAGQVRVLTATVLHGAYEVRISEVTAPGGHRVRDGGYALAARQPPTRASGADWARVTRPDGLTSLVIGLSGFTGAAVRRATDANAFGPHSATPYLTADVEHGGTRLYVSLIALTTEGPDGPGRPSLPPDGADRPRLPPDGADRPRLPPDGPGRPRLLGVDRDEVSLAFPGGDVVTVRLGARPAYSRTPATGAPPVRWTADAG